MKGGRGHKKDRQKRNKGRDRDVYARVMTPMVIRYLSTNLSTH